MRVLRALGLSFLSTTEGPQLHIPHRQSLISGELLSKPGLAAVLVFCRTWREREEVEARLVSSAGLTPKAAQGAVDQLLQLGVLVDEQEPQHRRVGEHSQTWAHHGWSDAFLMHLYTGSIERDDWNSKDALAIDVGRMREYVAAEKPPAQYKEYLDSPFVELSKPSQLSHGTLEQALARDGSALREPKSPLSLEQFSWLTYLAFGQTAVRHLPVTKAHVAKTSPSGGSRHPTEIYPIVLDVEGVAPGLYHYSVKRHGLELLKPGRHEAFVQEALVRIPHRAAFPRSVAFVFSTLFDRSMFRYRESFSYRVMHHDLGHVGQTMALLANSIDRNSYRGYTPDDARVEQFLSIDGLNEAAMMFAIVG